MNDTTLYGIRHEVTKETGLGLFMLEPYFSDAYLAHLVADTRGDCEIFDTSAEALIASGEETVFIDFCPKSLTLFIVQTASGEYSIGVNSDEEKAKLRNVLSEYERLGSPLAKSDGDFASPEKFEARKASYREWEKDKPRRKLRL